MRKIILFATLFTIPVWAQKAEVSFPLKVVIHGPNPIRSTSERIQIEGNGEAVLTTLAPFSEGNAENAVGTFALTLKPDQMEKLKAMYLKLAGAATKESIFPAEAEVLTVEAASATPLRWQLGQNEISDSWINLYQELRAQALTKPIAALQARCARETTGFICVLKNIGTKSLTVQDPTTVRGGVGCLAENGISRALAGLPTASRSWEIAGGATRSFSIMTKEHCAYRLRLKTSAGDLSSNELN